VAPAETAALCRKAFSWVVQQRCEPAPEPGATDRGNPSGRSFLPPSGESNRARHNPRKTVKEGRLLYLLDWFKKELMGVSREMKTC